MNNNNNNNNSTTQAQSGWVRQRHTYSYEVTIITMTKASTDTGLTPIALEKIEVADVEDSFQRKRLEEVVRAINDKVQELWNFRVRQDATLQAQINPVPRPSLFPPTDFIPVAVAVAVPGPGPGPEHNFVQPSAPPLAPSTDSAWKLSSGGQHTHIAGSPTPYWQPGLLLETTAFPQVELSPMHRQAHADALDSSSQDSTVLPPGYVRHPSFHATYVYAAPCVEDIP